MSNEQYLIQQHAKRLYNNIPDFPDSDHKWLSIYIGKLTDDEFNIGIRVFINLMKDIITDIKKDPQNWGMRCYEAQYFYCNAPRTSQEKQTDNDLLRVGEIFYALGKSGDIINNALEINNKIFQSYKITKEKIIIERLKDLGFEFKNTEFGFSVSYTKNHSVLQVIKAYELLNWSKESTCQQILKAEWLNFGEGWGSRIAIDDYCRSLDIVQAQIVKSIYKMIKNYGYEVIIGTLTLEVKHKKDAKKLLVIKKERDDLSYIFRFDNITYYLTECDTSPDNIKDEIFNGFKHDYQCCGKKNCVGPIIYIRDGKTYGKCRLSGGIGFVNINILNSKIILSLLENEIKARLSLS